VRVHFGAGRAELHVRNLALDDYDKIPTALGPNFQTAFAPATVSFDVVWSGPITRRVSVANGTNGDQFAGDYVENQTTVTWSGTNLATGFRFTSDPGNFSTSAPGRAFAELGHEGNGTFAPQDSADTNAAVAEALSLPPPLRADSANPPASSASARGATALTPRPGDAGGQPLTNAVVSGSVPKVGRAARKADPDAISAVLFTEIGEHGLGALLR
jgi:hypothetical protein